MIGLTSDLPRRTLGEGGCYAVEADVSRLKPLCWSRGSVRDQESVEETTLALTPALSHRMGRMGEGDSFAASCRHRRTGVPGRFCPGSQPGADGEGGVRGSRRGRARFPPLGGRHLRWSVKGFFMSYSL